MISSATFVKVGWTEYLLFNDTHFESTSKPTQKEYHFPVKVALSCTVDGMLADMNLVEQLIDSVFQFSKMYWKSTNQQSLPVTIKYHEIVVENSPHFQRDILSNIGNITFGFCE